MRRIGLALAIAAIASCSQADPLAIRPQLVCPHAVGCDAIVWTIGHTAIAAIGGTHLRCRCLDQDARSMT